MCLCFAKLQSKMGQLKIPREDPGVLQPVTEVHVPILDLGFMIMGV